MKCRAAVAVAAHKPLELVEIDVAPPRQGEVLVRMVATGVCHTDVNALDGNDRVLRFPVVLGHEGAGIVEEVGPGVTSVAPGDHVITSCLPECGECDACTSGRTNVCEMFNIDQNTLLDGTTRFSIGGSPVSHFVRTSTFSEYSVIPEISLVKIDPAAKLETACYIACGVATGVGAVTHTAQIEPGSTVAVFGLGGVGLNSIQAARNSGASLIIGIDLIEDKAEIARTLGMTHFVCASSEEDVVGKIHELTGGGVHYAFESTGIVEVMRQAFESAKPQGGKAIIAGIARPGARLVVDPFGFLQGRQILGSGFGSLKARTDLPNLVDQYVSGELEVDSLISHRFPLEQINDAIELMRRGEGLRSVIEF